MLVILLMKRRSFGYSLLTISNRKTKLVQRAVTSTTAERHHRLLKASVTFPTFPPHWLTEHKERELNFTILVKKRGLLHDTKHPKDTMARSEDKYLNSSTSGSEAKLRCGATTTSYLTPFRLIMMYQLTNAPLRWNGRPLEWWWCKISWKWILFSSVGDLKAEKW